MFVRLLIILGVAALLWSIAARPSGARGDKVVYRVQAYDTLWSIASSHYDGDVRAAVWQIEHANGLRDPTVRPGQRLVLP